MLAAEKDDIEMVQILLYGKADVNLLDKWNDLALNYACGEHDKHGFAMGSSYIARKITTNNFETCKILYNNTSETVTATVEFRNKGKNHMERHNRDQIVENAANRSVREWALLRLVHVKKPETLVIPTMCSHLKLFECSEGFYCSKCEKKPKTMYGCRDCDYDLCDQCHSPFPGNSY